MATNHAATNDADIRDADPHAAIAHLLRRATFGPRPGTVERVVGDGLDHDAVLDRVLDDVGDRAGGGAGPDLEDDGRAAVIDWWLARLRDPQAGLHERMTWYWHGHLTTSLDSVEPWMMWDQHQLVRRFALGNYRDLLRAILTDPAMLVYLDGAGSTGDQPNENLARELMELFALGIGNFTEDDVKAGARALSGWWVDWDDRTATFDADGHYDRPVRFLGSRARHDVDSVVDLITAHPACARHVAARVHRHLVGLDPDPDEHERLAAHFRANDLEILPLVEVVLRGAAFRHGVRTRPRQPVEWLVAALAAVGADDAEIDPWRLADTGQVPFRPPNVAGWPDDDRWVDANQVLGRIEWVVGWGYDELIDVDVEPTVDSVLARCGLWSVSDHTRSVLATALAEQTEYDRGLELLYALALTSPEFSLI